MIITTGSVVSLIVGLIVLGVVFYFVEQIPMAAPFPAIVRVVAAICALLLVLSFFGIFTGFNIR